jgi:hypothetical protein
MPFFITDTPEKLKVEWVTASKSNLVAVTGDRTKILYEGDDSAFAQEVYNNVNAHYQQRVAERAKPDPKNPLENLEKDVQFKPVRKARF